MTAQSWKFIHFENVLGLLKQFNPLDIPLGSLIDPGSASLF